ncbi:tRNA lysidine(34) synthetase TilS, partial [Campylobacter coli]|nr:tRNA lysidine(34) synthetase TilS [Campylobacter coli]
MQIKDEILSLLKKGRNLLAFSYGSDSSALFHFLVQKKIDFDLVMINYKTRKNSD